MYNKKERGRAAVAPLFDQRVLCPNPFDPLSYYSSLPPSLFLTCWILELAWQPRQQAVFLRRGISHEPSRRKSSHIAPGEVITLFLFRRV